MIFGWDIGDVLYDNAKVTGWHTGYPDAHARARPRHAPRIPWEPDTAALPRRLPRRPGRRPHPACPRSLLKTRDRARAQEHGLSRRSSAPSSSSSSSRRRRIAAREGLPQPHAARARACSATRGCARASTRELMRDILDGMRAFDIEIEGLHTETGPGVYEAAIRYDDALRAADKAALFKTAMKQIAHAHGLSVTFMAKWNAKLPGLERPPAPEPVDTDGQERLRRRRAREHGSRRRAAPLPRRPARADARAHRALLAHHQQLQALRARRVGAAHRDLGRREPHLRDPRDQARAPRQRARRVPADRRRHEPVHRDGHLPRRRACAASRSSSSRRRRAARGRRERDGRRAALARARWRTRRSCWRRASARARDPAARLSSTTTCARASGRSASTSARSPTGSSSATSRAFDQRNDRGPAREAGALPSRRDDDSPLELSGSSVA